MLLKVVLNQMVVGYSWLNVWYQHYKQSLQQDTHSVHSSRPLDRYDEQQYSVFVEIQGIETQIDLTVITMKQSHQ